MESGSPNPKGVNSLGASQKQRRRRRKKMQDSRESAPAQLAMAAPDAPEPAPAPAPDAAEREACKIKLANVDYSCTEEEIAAAAAKAGTVVRLSFYTRAASSSTPHDIMRTRGPLKRCTARR